MDTNSVISVSAPLDKYEIRTLSIYVYIRLADNPWILRYQRIYTDIITFINKKINKKLLIFLIEI